VWERKKLKRVRIVLNSVKHEYFVQVETDIEGI
jgi:hypothetical protein